MKNEISMTEFYERLKGYAEIQGDVESMEFCDMKIKQIADKAAKAKEAQAIKKAATDAFKTEVAAILTTEGQTPDAMADALCEKLNDESITRQKVISRMKALIDDGVAVKDKNEEGKVVYRLA